MTEKQRAILAALGAVSLALSVGDVLAQAVATCSNPDGYANYHYRPPMAKRESGFQKDRVSGGLTTLQRLDSGEYDILIVDVRKQVISLRQDGGAIRLLRRGKSDATFLVFFPGMAIELYTFYVDAGGENRFDILQSKGGDNAPIHKSAVLSGSCSMINLDLIQ